MSFCECDDPSKYFLESPDLKVSNHCFCLRSENTCKFEEFTSILRRNVQNYRNDLYKTIIVSERFVYLIVNLVCIVRECRKPLNKKKD